MKLDQDDVDRICERVVDHNVDTNIVANQFEISRRRVQQLVKEYRERGEIPTLETPGRDPYAEYPDDLVDRVLAVHHTLDGGAVAVAHVLRVRDGLSIDHNRVHAILEEHDHVIENPNKQGRRRPWVRFEREYAGVTVHMDWYYNDQGDQVLGVEDDASRRVFDMIERETSSASQSVELLDSVREELEAPVPILEVITDHGTEFINTHRDGRPCLDHEFERYLHENHIEHTLCKVGRPQSNGKIERFFQTYDKHRWRFDSLEEFLTFYNEVRPHMSLDWDNLETPAEAFDRLLPSPAEEINDFLATEVSTDE
ncbi:MAG: integrase core domain-containing protein [Haloarculaceae archaeon]